ncbi:MAG: TonB-dependent receptor [Chitinophagaceae bacterium]|nr:TonB-dependent receptor [Chitinophagaceae bacterium]
MVGTMWQQRKTSMYSVYGTNLVDSVTNAGLMSKNNLIVSQDELQSWIGDSSMTRVSSRQRLNRALKYGDANYVEAKQLAYFGEFSLNWDKKIYLTYSHRFENSSIFPKDYRNYNYPAGSMSFIMSDILPFIKKGNIINFWKLRGSLASTARSPLPYSNQSVFANVTSSGGGYAYGFTNNNLYMEPEIQKTYEIGTEFKLLKTELELMSLITIL